MKKLTPRSRKNANQVSTGDEILWLLNLDNGRVFPWTAYLSVRKNFVDCDQHGNVKSPEQIPADHPWIQQQTTELREQLFGVGATLETLAEIGDNLTRAMQEKLRAIEGNQTTENNYPKPEEFAPGSWLESHPEIAAGFTGLSVRLNNRIELSARTAKSELMAMRIAAQNRIIRECRI